MEKPDALQFRHNTHNKGYGFLQNLNQLKQIDEAGYKFEVHGNIRMRK